MSLQTSAAHDADAAGWVLQAIANRKNHSAKRLVSPGPTQLQIHQIFGSAASAPDHGGEMPWRFVLLRENQRHLLGEAFRKALYERDHNASAEDLEKARQKAFHAPLLALAICKQDQSAGGIKNAERLISLGCAIQNILITATALGFGSGLTSGQAINAATVRSVFGVNDSEAGICFVNIGTVSSASKVTRMRPSLGSFLSYL